MMRLHSNSVDTRFPFAIDESIYRSVKVREGYNASFGEFIRIQRVGSFPNDLDPW